MLTEEQKNKIKANEQKVLNKYRSGLIDINGLINALRKIYHMFSS